MAPVYFSGPVAETRRVNVQEEDHQWSSDCWRDGCDPESPPCVQRDLLGATLGLTASAGHDVQGCILSSCLFCFLDDP